MTFLFSKLQYETLEDSLTELCSPYCDPQNNPRGICPPECTFFCNPSCYFPYPQLPSDVPTPLADYPAQQQRKTPLFLIFLTITIIIFFLCCITTCCKALIRSRREASGPQPQTDGGNHDNLDQARDPEVDHPIWHIRSVGLESSVISSINTCKYNRVDGVVEGTECAVCLSEFQEDEILRLLPNCKHAFHTPCIDKWLKSHTSCPICRAVIATNPVGMSSPAEHADSSC